jgi:hypothetical protein
VSGSGSKCQAKCNGSGLKGQFGDFPGIQSQGVGCDRRAMGFIGGRFSAETMRILVKSLSKGSSVHFSICVDAWMAAD